MLLNYFYISEELLGLEGMNCFILTFCFYCYYSSVNSSMLLASKILDLGSSYHEE